MTDRTWRTGVALTKVSPLGAPSELLKMAERLRQWD